MTKRSGMKRILWLALVLCMLLSIFGIEGFAATSASKPSKVVLTAKQASATSVSLTWKKVSGAGGYEVYRKMGTNGKYKKIQLIASGKTLSYKDKGLSLGKSYTYKVRAFKKINKKAVRGDFSSVKTVKLTNTKPKFTVTLPDTVDRKTKQLVIILTNNSKSDKTYFDGVFALEDLGDSGKTYNLKSVSYEKSDSAAKGSLVKGKTLTLKAGEEVRFACKFAVSDPELKYDKNKVRLTTCVGYKKQDYVSVYSTEEKNRIYTTEGYYQYLTGGQ